MRADRSSFGSSKSEFPSGKQSIAGRRFPIERLLTLSAFPSERSCHAVKPHGTFERASWVVLELGRIVQTAMANIATRGSAITFAVFWQTNGQRPLRKCIECPKMVKISDILGR